jgi:hypothetical protein
MEMAEGLASVKAKVFRGATTSRFGEEAIRPRPRDVSMFLDDADYN